MAILLGNTPAAGPPLPFPLSFDFLLAQGLSSHGFLPPFPPDDDAVVTVVATPEPATDVTVVAVAATVTEDDTITEGTVTEGTVTVGAVTAVTDTVGASEHRSDGEDPDLDPASDLEVFAPPPPPSRFFATGLASSLGSMDFFFLLFSDIVYSHYYYLAG